MDENIFRRLIVRLKSTFKKNHKKEPRSVTSSPEAEGKFFSLWSWALPLLLGLTTGWFVMTCIETWLDGLNGRNRPSASASFLTMSAQEVDTDNMTAFLRVNPFNVTPMTVLEPEPVSEDDAPPQIVGSLATAMLKGTSPGYMAWIEDQGKLRLVMLGDSFDVYTLEEVTYFAATFVKDEDRVVKEIKFERGGQQVASLPPQRIPEPREARRAIPPNPGRNEPGVIDRETVNQLLENPFDELRKVRLRPAANDQGLQIQWINRDSILARLGVQKDDVVHAINGIAFRNAMDINNSLSSLMTSDQFVVEVIRNGAATTLQYDVR